MRWLLLAPLWSPPLYCEGRGIWTTAGPAVTLLVVGADHDEDLDDQTWRRHPSAPDHRDTSARIPASRHTPPGGWPVVVVEQPTRSTGRMVAAVPQAADESGPIGTPEDRLARLERRDRGRRKWIAGGLVSGLGSLGAVVIWALNARDAAVTDRVKAQVVEGDLRALRAEFRQLQEEVVQLRIAVYSSAPSLLWRRDDRPNVTPWTPAPAPARKDPEP